MISFTGKIKILFLSILSLYPPLVLADVVIPNPINATSFPDLLNTIASWLIYLAIPVATGAIIFSGIQYMTAGGDENKLKSAKNTLTYAILGFILVLIAKGLVLAIKSIL